MMKAGSFLGLIRQRRPASRERTAKSGGGEKVPNIALRRGILVVVLLLFGTVAAFLILNIEGWRAHVLSRLTRVDNDPVVVLPPPGFQPQVPPGFKVSVFARDFAEPRWLAVAPNGDVFVADSAAGKVVVLSGGTPQANAGSRTVFADHLNLPFGIAFHKDYVYIADTNEVLRFPHDLKTARRLGNSEHIMDLPGLGYHQHWTRSLAFSNDGDRLFISVGSRTNVSIESDPRRAAILAADPDGRNLHVYASGLRNAVGIACNPQTGALWASVNERDDIGDDVPADYFTHVTAGGFYGWPYSYLGSHVDDRVSRVPTWWPRRLCRTCCWALTSPRSSLPFTRPRSSRPTFSRAHSLRSTVPGTAAFGAVIRSSSSPSKTVCLPAIPRRSFPDLSPIPGARQYTDGRPE
jgi:Glucose / Sorbosone dehydrogenase